MTHVCTESHFVAYSMKQAATRLQAESRPDQQVSQLGGMTDFLGMIHDSDHGDCIIVGMATAGKMPWRWIMWWSHCVR